MRGYIKSLGSIGPENNWYNRNVRGKKINVPATPIKIDNLDKQAIQYMISRKYNRNSETGKYKKFIRVIDYDILAPEDFGKLNAGGLQTRRYSQLRHWKVWDVDAAKKRALCGDFKLEERLNLIDGAKIDKKERSAGILAKIVYNAPLAEFAINNEAAEALVRNKAYKMSALSAGKVYVERGERLVIGEVELNDGTYRAFYIKFVPTLSPNANKAKWDWKKIKCNKTWKIAGRLIPDGDLEKKLGAPQKNEGENINLPTERPVTAELSRDIPKRKINGNSKTNYLPSHQSTPTAKKIPVKKRIEDEPKFNPLKFIKELTRKKTESVQPLEAEIIE